MRTTAREGAMSEPGSAAGAPRRACLPRTRPSIESRVGSAPYSRAVRLHPLHAGAHVVELCGPGLTVGAELRRRAVVEAERDPALFGGEAGGPAQVIGAPAGEATTVHHHDRGSAGGPALLAIDVHGLVRGTVGDIGNVLVDVDGRVVGERRTPGPARRRARQTPTTAMPRAPIGRALFTPRRPRRWRLPES